MFTVFQTKTMMNDLSFTKDYSRILPYGITTTLATSLRTCGYDDQFEAKNSPINVFQIRSMIYTIL